MNFRYAFPPDHDQRMQVLEQTTASLGWGRDEDDMTMIQRKAVALMAMAQDVLAGRKPVLRPLVAEFVGLCAQLNVERHGEDKGAATRLLSSVDSTRDELRRLWANPHLPEIQQQLALLAPLYKVLNDRLNGQWPECRASQTLSTAGSWALPFACVSANWPSGRRSRPKPFKKGGDCIGFFHSNAAVSPLSRAPSRLWQALPVGLTPIPCQGLGFGAPMVTAAVVLKALCKLAALFLAVGTFGAAVHNHESFS